MSADAHHITAPHPEGLGAMNVMKNAPSRCQHGPVRDRLHQRTPEPLRLLATLQNPRLFARCSRSGVQIEHQFIQINDRHLLGAAGAIETIACIMAVSKDVVPPTINHFTDFHPSFHPDLNFTFNKAQERTVTAALSNTFGFGGHNASVIVKSTLNGGMAHNRLSALRIF